MKYDVFISYSRKDRYINGTDGNIIPGNIVDKLVELFKKHDLNPWIDKEGIRIAEDYLIKICGAIDTSLVVVFVSSKNSHNPDGFTHMELNYARNNGHPIFSVELGTAPKNGPVAMLTGVGNHIDITSLGEQKAFEKLIADLTKK